MTQADLAIGAARRRGNPWLLRTFDKLTITSALGGALLMVLLLVVLAVAIFIGALPSIRAFGFSFFTTSMWNPVTARFGAWPVIEGTLLTSLLAIAFAVPISIGSAVFLVKLAPKIRIPIPRMRTAGRRRFTFVSPRPLVTVASFLIELLAAIPSIAYGLWAIAVLVPFMQTTVQPWASATLGKLSFAGQWFANPGPGTNIFTASLVLAIMVTPIMTAIIRDVLAAAPIELEQGALGLGATWWQATKLVLEYSKLGIVGAIILGFARAIGETMAVTMVVGNSMTAPTSLFSPGQTISSLLANQFAEADSDAFVHALVYAALVLLVITTLINGVARVMVTRMVRGTR